MSKPLPKKALDFIQTITPAELDYIADRWYLSHRDKQHNSLKKAIFEQDGRLKKDQYIYPGEILDLGIEELELGHEKEFSICMILIIYNRLKTVSGQSEEYFWIDFNKDKHKLPPEYADLIEDCFLTDFDKTCICLTNEQMAEADRLTIESGIPGFTLMQTAGQKAAEIILERYKPQDALVLCGPGNNGGDGFIVAEILKNGGWNITLACLVPLENLKGDAAKAAAHWSGEIGSFENLWIDPETFIIDAVFGTGFKGEFRQPAETAFVQISVQENFVVAIDIPSGVNGTRGSTAQWTPYAKHTITFCRPKFGHYLPPGEDHCGLVDVVDIGIPDECVRQAIKNKPKNWA